MFEISKVYIRSIVAIAGLTFVMLYSIHLGNPDTNVMLAGIAAIVACVVLDKQVPTDN